MAITSAIVLFAVIWFLVLFIVLPIRLDSQADRGKVARGTPSSAPADPQIKKRALIVTAITVVLWAIAVVTILSGVISTRDIDWFNRMGDAPEAGETNG